MYNNCNTYVHVINFQHDNHGKEYEKRSPYTNALSHFSTQDSHAYSASYTHSRTRSLRGRN